jgi:RND family efflux transporter MFP subunit
MPDYPEPRRYRSRIIVALAVMVALAAWGIFSRREAAADLKIETEELAIPSVRVMTAASGAAHEEVVLPGTVQAWHEAPIYARTNGYVKSWKTDIGARVKEGDLLAEIETPEVDAQFHQAEADLATAEANDRLAQSTAIRWKTLLKTNSVSKQETDEKVSDAAAKAAATASARANVDRLKQLESFKRVVAPFDGIITARNIDNGSLINAGSGTAGGLEMFHIADVHELRVYVQVPETYTIGINSQLKAELHFTEHPGKVFDALLVDTAHAFDPGTRTLLVQFSVNNIDGNLMPGGYTEAHLLLPSRTANVRLPVNTLVFRSGGLQVGVVDAEGKAQLKDITLGRDFGKEVEVTAGISPGDTIIINPPDSLISGEKVRVMAPEKSEEKKDDKKS